MAALCKRLITMIRPYFNRRAIMSEVKIPEKLQYELMSQLEDLESTTDLEGTALVTKYGHRIASSSRVGVDEDPHSATPATMIIN